MPEPAKKGETKNSFISRCMSSEEMMKEFPNQKQRAAVCFSKWTKTHPDDKKDGENKTEDKTE